MTYSHVLVGTDGSTTAAQAVDAAARTAVATGAPVVIVTAWQRHTADPPALSEESRYPGGSVAAMDAQWAIETTSDAAGIARARGVEDVRQVQAVGAPAEALLESASTYPDALLVVGTAGLTERAERATTGAVRGATMDEVRVKFQDCAGIALTGENAASVLEMLDNLEDMGDVGPLADLLGG